MTKSTSSKGYCAFLLIFWLVVGIGLAETTNLNSNTPIRVLLDRAATTGKIQSSLSGIFARGADARHWTQLGKELNVSKAGNQVIMSGFGFPIGGTFSRGGPMASDKIEYRGRSYRGALKWIPTPKGMMVINHLTLEDYLIGTLGSEMSPNWEMEALKAQAVASRTYALYMVRHPKNPEYDLEADTQDQMYGGVSAENQRVVEALKSTQNQILSFNGLPIKAFFHSRCGGTTETPDFVWNLRSKHPQRKASCEFCRKFPLTWQATVSGVDFLKSLRLPFSNPFHLEAGSRSASGRLSSIKVVAGSQKADISTDQLRGSLGYTKIKSAKFDWKMQGDSIAFEGVGNGHGVGMCQWGARHLAKQGKTYREILAHYYPGATLQ